MDIMPKHTIGHDKFSLPAVVVNICGHFRFWRSRRNACRNSCPALYAFSERGLYIIWSVRISKYVAVSRENGQR